VIAWFFDYTKLVVFQKKEIHATAAANMEKMFCVRQGGDSVGSNKAGCHRL
jgi:putative hemolysin